MKEPTAENIEKKIEDYQDQESTAGSNTENDNSGCDTRSCLCCGDCCTSCNDCGSCDCGSGDCCSCDCCDCCDCS